MKLILSDGNKPTNSYIVEPRETMIVHLPDRWCVIIMKINGVYQATKGIEDRYWDMTPRVNQSIVNRYKKLQARDKTRVIMMVMGEINIYGDVLQ